MILVSLGAREFFPERLLLSLWGTVELCPEGTAGLSLRFQSQVPINKTPRPEGAVEPARRVCRVDQMDRRSQISSAPFLLRPTFP
jgi:hypothetical protein